MMLYTVLALAVVCGISEAVVCKTKDDCGAGECCYIQPEFLVASKRLLVLPPVHQHHDTGVCEKYRLQDDHCYPLETANGHCGCGSGLSCQWVPDPTVTAGHVRRSQIYHPGPGAYRCAPRQ
ncbi:uncharacterized protein LOC123547872 [Mercenaria mercenaria]|uniref:uncharacterized protein LOC123547872 n=1 Tax=Mercenaria mercenaria TaxID=6596 RepID=UPI001E1DF3A2|nr:uncharacterized protein LOC123547872 [Mercenaria mercenaria]